MQSQYRPIITHSPQLHRPLIDTAHFNRPSYEYSSGADDLEDERRLVVDEEEEQSPRPSHRPRPTTEHHQSPQQSQQPQQTSQHNDRHEQCRDRLRRSVEEEEAPKRSDNPPPETAEIAENARFLLELGKPRVNSPPTYINAPAPLSTPGRPKRYLPSIYETNPQQAPHSPPQESSIFKKRRTIPLEEERGFYRDRYDEDAREHAAPRERERGDVRELERSRPYIYRPPEAWQGETDYSRPEFRPRSEKEGFRPPLIQLPPPPMYRTDRQQAPADSRYHNESSARYPGPYDNRYETSPPNSRRGSLRYGAPGDESYGDSEPSSYSSQGSSPVQWAPNGNYPHYPPHPSNAPGPHPYPYGYPPNSMPIGPYYSNGMPVHDPRYPPHRGMLMRSGEGAHSDFIGGHKKRKSVSRQRATPEQVDYLEKIYLRGQFPSPRDLEIAAEDLGMTLKKVRNWFQNKRAKERRTKPDAPSPTIVLPVP